LFAGILTITSTTPRTFGICGSLDIPLALGLLRLSSEKQAVDSWNNPRGIIQIITKVGLVRPAGEWLPNVNLRQLRKSVVASLRELGTEQLFSLQLHAHDSRVPFKETLARLADL